MLVLTRRVGETIVIGDKVKITVVAVLDDKVRLGIEAPPEVGIVREELLQAVRDENRAAVHVSVTSRDLPRNFPAKPGKDRNGRTDM